jgi:hypothetical protein
MLKLDECVLQGEIDPYAVPKSMGIFQTIRSPKSITTLSVATRIVDNHEAYKVCNAFVIARRFVWFLFDWP